MIKMSKFRYLDKHILFAVFALQTIGILAISSATRVNAGADIRTLNMQILWMIISNIILLFISMSNVKFINEDNIGFLGYLSYFASIGMLLSVLAVGTGNGASRWLRIGGFTLQPSEFAKLGIIIFLTNLFYKNKDRVNDMLFIFRAVILLGIPLIMIAKQPDLSTSLVFLVIFAAQYFVAGINGKFLKVAVLAGSLVAAIFIADAHLPKDNHLILKNYQANRIMAIFYPENYQLSEAYQTTKSIRAVGSGKILGKGIYKGTLNQLSYLPEPHTDFIFSVISEESGFIGSLVVLGLQFFIIIKCIYIGKDVNNYLDIIFITGVVAMLAIQVFINIGVATGIMPNTGIPLPFVSYGGSSMLTNIVCIALVLNIGRHRKIIF
ncbi:MAG: rod shape-determining protein RodA [Clostridia bacterium]|jgi:rod shape determining protein RodA|nr:rod shape-determining protein RodA [Clostridia bacterium]